MTTHARPGIPRDYNELLRNFGPFIANEIRKRNTVVDNFEDAYQDVLLKIFEARIIEKFHDRCSDAVAPETMPVAQVCETLGITKKQWSARGWAYFVGYLQSDGSRKQGQWMPQPINYPAGKGYASKKAVYSGADITQLLTQNEDMHWKNQGPIMIPSHAPPTAYQFLNYLGTACRNHFANFCRTRSRKWKDRTGDSMPGKRLLGEDTPQFRTEEGAYNNHWEDTIRDDVATNRMEAQVILSRTLDKLTARGVEEQVQKEIFVLLSDGYTLVEAIDKSSLTEAKKRTLTRAFL